MPPHEDEHRAADVAPPEVAGADDALFRPVRTGNTSPTG
jgi:hypothetical protein